LICFKLSAKQDDNCSAPGRRPGAEQLSSCLATNNHREVHHGVYCAGNMVGTGGVPGRRGPTISYINPRSGCTSKVRCAIFGFVLAILSDNQDMERTPV